MTARLLMVALDAADGQLLDEWSRTGVLPNLGALRARGTVKRLTSPIGATDDALWASFQYGVPVGEHGRYYYVVPVSGRQLGLAYRLEDSRIPFWQRLSEESLRVAILDVPKCVPPRPLNGIHLADWLVHGHYFGEARSYPPQLAHEIVERFGQAPPSRCGYRQEALSDSDVLEIIANLRTSISRKRAAGLHYLAAEPWDLFVIGFKEAHCAGHGLLDLVDARHAHHDPARNIRLGEPVRRIFEELDAAVGDLVTAAGPDAEVMIFSTSDMVPNGSLSHLMPGIVARLNAHLHARHGAPRLRNGPAHGALYCAALPYNENFGALRVNRAIAGENRAEYERMLCEIEGLLGELADIDSGRPAVEAFTRPFLEHKGAMARSLPDLLVQYRTNVFPRGVSSARLDCIEAAIPRMRPGNHAEGGILMAAGPLLAKAVCDINALKDFASVAVRILRNSGGTPASPNMAPSPDTR